MFVCRACLRGASQELNQDLSRRLLLFAPLKPLHHGHDPRAVRSSTYTTVAPKRSTSPRRALSTELKSPRATKSSTATSYLVIDSSLKLVERVRTLLRKRQDGEAHELILKHSKSLDAVVAWNTLINYHADSGDLHGAIKLYNEMKKRAQKPNAQTFTILLRGFAKYPRTKGGLAVAVKLYDSMFADNSPVKPSTIHANAIINVCARARDQDALFEVVSRLPQNGPGSPDALTYSIILNALRFQIDQKSDWKEKSAKRHKELKETSDQGDLPAKKQQVMIQGRVIWSEVVSKWKNGKINMDEELACAMARLLLVSASEADGDAIFSLAEQTMGLKRALPPIGHSKRPTHIGYRRRVEASKETSTTGEGAQKILSPASKKSEESNNSHENLNEDHLEEFRPLEGKFKVKLAEPGRNILSALIQVCLRFNAIDEAHHYWGIITQKVEPDLENYKSYLRLLRWSRSSSMGLELLKEMAKDKKNGGLGVSVDGQSFRIALSSCHRDWKNPGVFDNALAIMQLATESSAEIDDSLLETFQELLKNSNVTFTYAEMEQATQVMDKLITQIRSRAHYGDWDLSSRSKVNEAPPELVDSTTHEQLGKSRHEPIQIFDRNKGRFAHQEYEKKLYKAMGIFRSHCSRIMSRYREYIPGPLEDSWIYSVHQINQRRMKRLEQRGNYHINANSDRRKYAKQVDDRGLPELEPDS